MYLRVVDVMRKQGVEAFVDDYVRFNKTWAQRPLSREEALEDLRIHPIFTLDEQLALFHPQAGRLRDWLRGIIGFYGRLGTLSQQDILKLNEFGYLNDSFLKELQY